MTDNTFVEDFDSWESYVKAAEDAPSSNTGVYASSGDFNGYTTFKQAVTLAKNGWHEHHETAERYASHVEALVDVELFQSTFQSTFDVSGGEVDLGRFLSGEPECMIECTPLRVARKGRAVRLVVPFGYRGHVETEQAIARGAAIVALADLLAKAQHPVEIIATRTQQFHGRVRKYHANILVQSANDPLDIDRLLFVFAHPAAYRRIGFATLNTDRLGSKAPDSWNNQGGQVQPMAAYLSNAVENTHIFPHLEAHQDWSEAGAKAWVEAQLAEILA